MKRPGRQRVESRLYGVWPWRLEQVLIYCLSDFRDFQLDTSNLIGEELTEHTRH